MPDTNAALRRSVYLLLILAACGTVIGRIWSVQSPLGKTPLLSANDRSRWSTVRALVDHGTFVLDDVIFEDAEQTKRAREWYSIDLVRHKGDDGREHYYSSKPPLLATLVAGQYWLLKQLTGMTLGEQPFYVVRGLLIAVNVLPLALYFLLLAALVEKYGATDWGRLFVMVSATFGTFLTTFAVTLNNHLMAAVSVAVAVWAALPIWRDGERRWPLFAVSGFFAAFAVTNELPALAFLGLLGVALFWRSPSRTLLAFLPAAAVVGAAFFGTNHVAHGTWKPPYAHRQDGPLIAAVASDSAAQWEQGQLPESLRQALSEAGIELSPGTTVEPRLTSAGWVLWDPQGQNRFALVREGLELRVHQWDNWYDYERSYWVTGRKTGVDLGEPSLLVYALHVLVGHHGIFSLTPIWLFSAAGAGWWLLRGESRMRGFAALVVALTLICVAFYVFRPLEDRNYGGVCSGFRWVFWFAPLWLIVMLPAADGIATRPIWRRLALALLLISVVSAAYSPLNPWSHPWLYEYWAFLGWVQP